MKKLLLAAIISFLFSTACFGQSPATTPPVIPTAAPVVETATSYSITRLELVFGADGTQGETLLHVSIGAGKTVKANDPLRGDNVDVFIPFGSQTAVNARVSQIVGQIDALVAGGAITAQQAAAIKSQLTTLHNSIYDFANTALPLLQAAGLFELPPKERQVRVQ